jgi:hypothetical protein
MKDVPFAVDKARVLFRTLKYGRPIHWPIAAKASLKPNAHRS